jgi:threonine aldolase
LRRAEHANARAAMLEEQLRALAEVEIMFPRQANSLFVKIPQAVARSLHEKGWHFYTFIGVGGVRLMCSWDTTERAIQDFMADLKRALAGRT